MNANGNKKTGFFRVYSRLFASIRGSKKPLMNTKGSKRDPLMNANEHEGTRKGTANERE